MNINGEDRADAGLLSSVRRWLPYADLADAAAVLPGASALRLRTSYWPPTNPERLFAREIELRIQRRVATLVRQGQANGTVRGVSRMPGVSSPWEFLTRNTARLCYQTYDGVSDEAFEATIAAMWAGDVAPRTHDIVEALGYVPHLTRRSINSTVGRITEMASSGHSSAQIADKLGVRAHYVRLLARREGIALADDHVPQTLAVRPDRVMATTVATLEGVAMGVELIDVDGLDPDQISSWVASIRASLRPINQLLKEMTR